MRVLLLDIANLLHLHVHCIAVASTVGGHGGIHCFLPPA
jgi:hypothetical protein